MNIMNYSYHYLLIKRKSPVDKSDIEREIINLTKQKKELKKLYMSEVVELDDFKEDLKVINEKLDILTKQLEKEQELKNRNRFTPEKVMADEIYKGYLCKMVVMYQCFLQSGKQ